VTISFLKWTLHHGIDLLVNYVDTGQSDHEAVIISEAILEHE